MAAVQQWFRRRTLRFNRLLRTMRLRPTRRLFCVIITASILGFSLLLWQRPHLHLSLSSHPSPPLSTPSSSLHIPQDPLPKDQPPFPVPPKPSLGDIPEYPIPDELKEKKDDSKPERGEGGGGGGGLINQGQIGESGIDAALRMASEKYLQQQQEESPLRTADQLWDLVVAPKPSGTAESHQRKSPPGCMARHHIFFGKVHKTGSSTVANILQRYGYIRDLNFLLPRKQMSAMSYNYLTMPGQKPTRSRVIPAPLGQHHDIMWCHAVYHSYFFHGVMPQDTIYVTILRHPLEQFQSAFEYYGRMPGSYLNGILQMNVSNPLAMYLQNPEKYEKPPRLTSYIRNKQSQDLGMTSQHVLNATLRWTYIHQLGQDFQLVMITEFFDESLVLLRRLMCWSLKDILYIPKNKNNFRKPRTFSSEDLVQHRLLNVADYDLYEFFYNRFHQILKAQGPDLVREVDIFKRVLQRVQLYCTQGLYNNNNHVAMTVQATQWSEGFSVSRYDCSLMQKAELPFLNDLMLEAVRKYQRSALQNAGS